MSPPPPTSGLPPRPWTQRGYATLAVALAVFLGSMVVLRVPFRGYLVEGRVSGCLDAALTEADLRQFLQETAGAVHKRIDLAPSGCCEVVFQTLAPRAGDAQAAIDRASRQVADVFVAQRRQAARQIRLARYQAELQTAREAEDTLRLRLEQLRQEQLAAASRPSEELPLPTTAAAAGSSGSDSAGLIERLQSLRRELSQLLATRTDEHPAVIALKSQIARLESELNPAEAIPTGPLSDRNASRPHAHHVSTLGLSDEDGPGDFAAQLDNAAADLMAATRARQWAERQLQTQIQSLASISTVPWSIEPAQVTARVGGTPRILTLLAASLVTLLAAAIMLRASRILTPPKTIASAEELEELLAVPLVGRMPAPLSHRPPRMRRFGPLAVRTILHTAELFLVLMVAALAFTMLADRSLAPQVLLDPLGVLSEVADRVFA